MCFELWAKRNCQSRLKSVHLYCYNSFKWRLHVCNSYHHCLVYVLLEDLNQISRTEKCHFAFYIFHEQRFHSFTSIQICKIKSCCVMMFSVVYFYLYVTNLQKKTSFILCWSVVFISSLFWHTDTWGKMLLWENWSLKWQYVIFLHANWLVLFIFDFIKYQYCVKITAIKFIRPISSVYCLHG